MNSISRTHIARIRIIRWLNKVTWLLLLNPKMQIRRCIQEFRKLMESIPTFPFLRKDSLWLWDKLQLLELAVGFFKLEKSLTILSSHSMMIAVSKTTKTKNWRIKVSCRIKTRCLISHRDSPNACKLCQFKAWIFPKKKEKFQRESMNIKYQLPLSKNTINLFQTFTSQNLMLVSKLSKSITRTVFTCLKAVFLLQIRTIKDQRS